MSWTDNRPGSRWCAAAGENTRTAFDAGNAPPCPPAADPARYGDPGIAAVAEGIR